MSGMSEAKVWPLGNMLRDAVENNVDPSEYGFYLGEGVVKIGRISDEQSCIQTLEELFDQAGGQFPELTEGEVRNVSAYVDVDDQDRPFSNDCTVDIILLSPKQLNEVLRLSRQ